MLLSHGDTPVLLCLHHGAEVEQARGVPEVLERGTGLETTPHLLSPQSWLARVSSVTSVTLPGGKCPHHTQQLLPSPIPEWVKSWDLTSMGFSTLPWPGF